MEMIRKLIFSDFKATLDRTISLRDALPPTHSARFVVDISDQYAYKPECEMDRDSRSHFRLFPMNFNSQTRQENGITEI
jgi:hypothetical protein